MRRRALFDIFTYKGNRANKEYDSILNSALTSSTPISKSECTNDPQAPYSLKKYIEGRLWTHAHNLCCRAT